MYISLSSGDQCGWIQRRENLIDHILSGPTLRCHEILNGFLLINSVDNLLPHVFVRESQRVTSLMPNNTIEFGIRSIHRETVKVHRRLIGGYLENIGS